MKDLLKEFLGVYPNLKSVLIALLKNGARVSGIRLSPEVNDWRIALVAGPITDIGPCDNKLLYLDLDSRYNNCPKTEDEDYILLGLDETVQMIKELYGDGGSPERPYVVTLERDYCESYYKENISLTELNTILEEDRIAAIKKMEADRLCRNALRYLNRYFISEVSDKSRVFPKRYFKGKTESRVLMTLYRYDSFIRSYLKYDSDTWEVSDLIDSAIYHLGAMRRYGKRVPRKGLKISI